MWTGASIGLSACANRGFTRCCRQLVRQLEDIGAEILQFEPGQGVIQATIPYTYAGACRRACAHPCQPRLLSVAIKLTPKLRLILLLLRSAHAIRRCVELHVAQLSTRKRQAWPWHTERAVCVAAFMGIHLGGHSGVSWMDQTQMSSCTIAFLHQWPPGKEEVDLCSFRFIDAPQEVLFR